MDYKMFKSVSGKEWREKIINDLKGKPYDSLVSEDRNGIKVFPDHSERKEHSPNIMNPGWEWRQDFDCSHAQRANKQILDSLSGGCNAIGLHKYDPNELKTILSGVLPQYIKIHFGLTSDPDLVLDELDNWIETIEIDRNELSGSFGFDPIGYGVKTGSWSKAGKADQISPLLEKTKDWPSMKPFIVRGDIYHNGGANLVNELALSIAQGHEYLVAMVESGIDPTRAYHSIGFSLGIGSDFLGEIAKYRAIRLLWEFIGKQYTQAKSDLPVEVHGVTSRTNMSVMDEHNNILRATGEAMSAIAGGVNSLAIRCFSELSKERDPHGERITRNIHHLLKEESHLNKVADPAKGSYYIEYFTSELCQKAWERFKSIEKSGGLIQELESGKVHQAIEHDKNEFMASVKEDKNVLIGVNKYPNSEEKPKTAIEPRQPSGSDIQAIEPFRVAVEMEKKEEHHETH